MERRTPWKKNEPIVANNRKRGQEARLITKSTWEREMSDCLGRTGVHTSWGKDNSQNHGNKQTNEEEKETKKIKLNRKSYSPHAASLIKGRTCAFPVAVNYGGPFQNKTGDTSTNIHWKAFNSQNLTAFLSISMKRENVSGCSFVFRGL